MKNFAEDGTMMAELFFTTLDSRFCGKYLKTVIIGGVGTYPEYRRSGAVREMLEYLFSMAEERKWTVSFLHPFSFSYYRKFGYERVADHKVIRIPMAKLEHFERVHDLVPVNSPELISECDEVFERFADTRNIMFSRYGKRVFTEKYEDGRKTYLWRDDCGKAAGYITVQVDKTYWVNRFIDSKLQVHEFAFTSPQALKALFGFIRMYEGECDQVLIHNCAMAPEVDQLLRHYMHAEYQIIPDLAVRVFDVPALLRAAAYPEEKGSFTVEVTDAYHEKCSLPMTQGKYRVDFEAGEAQVTVLPEDADCEVQTEVSAFAQLLYGYEEYDAGLAAYVEGVTIRDPRSDFFKICHKKNNGLFEMF